MDIDELEEFDELEEDLEVADDLDDIFDSFDETSGESLGEDENTLDQEEPAGERLTIDEGGVYCLEPGEYTILTPEDAETLDEGAEILEGSGSIDDTTMVLDEPCEVWMPEGATLAWPFGSKPKKVPIVLTVNPISGDLDTNFRLTIRGANPKKKVLIKIDRRPFKLDYTIGQVRGNGSTVVTGHTLSRKLKLPPNTENKLMLYGQEKLLLLDRKTARVQVYVITTKKEAPPAAAPYTPPAYVTPPYTPTPTPSAPPYVAPTPTPTPYVPPGVTPTPTPGVMPAAITPSMAIEGIRAGKQYYIKFAIPILDMLPGLPYSPGIPILPGFKISETP